MIIRGFGKVTIKKLADWAIMDRTTVTRNLKLLEKKGSIRIEPGKDHRERVVTLTHEGITALVAAIPFWEKAQHHVGEIFGKDRTSRVVRELSKMVSTVRNK